MADLEIFVVILGDAPASKKMFSVIAKPSDSVDKWRKGVYHESGLSGTVARDLVLWKVRLLYSLCPLDVLTSFPII